VTYDVVIAIGDTRVFQQANVNHKYLARWRKVFAVGALQESPRSKTWRHLSRPARCPVSVNRGVAVAFAQDGRVSGTGFDILDFRRFDRPMNAHSGRPDARAVAGLDAQSSSTRRPRSERM